jgi:hypothetical protein
MILTKDFDFPRVLQDLLRGAAYDDTTRQISSVVFDIWDVLQSARRDALVVSILRSKKHNYNNCIIACHLQFWGQI